MMSEDREPFFTAKEWKAIAQLRPRAWWEWWSTEPLVTKILATVLALLMCFGAYLLLSGNSELGGLLVGLVGLLLSLFVLTALANVLGASIRWALRKSGLLAIWHRIRNRVFAVAKFAVWSLFAGGALIGLWPYLSLNPAKSWYAMTNEVPVEQVEVAKKPHDCEFETAPLGSKHCHYDANTAILKGGDSPDGKKYVLVTYEKVED